MTLHELRRRIRWVELQEIIEYQPDTGQFYWRCNGKRVDYRTRGQRWRTVKIHGLIYPAHVVAWFYMHGKWSETIAHKNGRPSDNRACNLCELEDIPAPEILPRFIHKEGDLYAPRVKIGNTYYDLGRFEKLRDAIDEYWWARKNPKKVVEA